MSLPRIHAGLLLALAAGSALVVQVVPSLAKRPPTGSDASTAIPLAASAVGPLLEAADPASAPAGGTSLARLERAVVLEDVALAPPVESEFLSPSRIASIQAPVQGDGWGLLAWPVGGSISSGYGQRDGEFHRGIDIAAPFGQVVRAAESGVVTQAGWYYDYGRIVVIRHPGGFETLYGHNARLLVSVGDEVERGQPIALVGSSGRSTGPHLHFEVHVGGRAVNPLSYLAR